MRPWPGWRVPRRCGPARQRIRLSHLSYGAMTGKGSATSRREVETKETRVH
jgi:hypothetical protein